jgi:hypothetical protein
MSLILNLYISNILSSTPVTPGPNKNQILNYEGLCGTGRLLNNHLQYTKIGT